MGTHSLHPGFAMELFLARVYPETIMIIERWYINDFLMYIRIQASNPRKGISGLISNKKAFYTITKQESYTIHQDSSEHKSWGYIYKCRTPKSSLPPSFHRAEITPKEGTLTRLSHKITKHLIGDVSKILLSFCLGPFPRALEFLGLKVFSDKFS